MMKVEEVRKRSRKDAMISIKVTKEILAWMKEKQYSHTKIFYAAIKELGYKE